MAAIRQRLRLWTLAWFVLQAASLSALAPRDCCAAHRPAAAATPCHDVAPGSQCPMPSADGTPCPMHRADASRTAAASAEAHHHDAAPDTQPPDDCVMRGTCQAPTFFTLFPKPGVLLDTSVRFADVATTAPTTDHYEHPLGRVRARDPRPPRA